MAIQPRKQYPPSWIDPSDFSNQGRASSNPLEKLPEDVVQKIGLCLGVAGLGSLSCTNTLLYTFTTEKMWKLLPDDFELTSTGSAKDLIKTEFFKIYTSCLEIFVATFGVKNLMKIQVEDSGFDPSSSNFALTPLLLKALKTHHIIRKNNFRAFLFCCQINNTSLHAVSMAIDDCGANALKFHIFPNQQERPLGWTLVFINTKQVWSDLNNFSKTGSVQLPIYFRGVEDSLFRLDENVLKFLNPS